MDTKLSSQPTTLNSNGWIFDTSKTADVSYDAGNWTFRIRTSGANTNLCQGNLYVVVGRTSGGATPTFTTFFYGDVGSEIDICNDAATTYSDLAITSNCNGGGSNCAFSAGEPYLMINFYLYITANSNANSTAINFEFEDAPANCTNTSNCPNVVTSFWLPEKLLFLMVTAPFIPMVVIWMRKRKLASQLTLRVD